ncbi:MAG TPA: hypothetical protein DE036_06730 [Actinobacteria bacterium]|nr:hypothetical protein [Actinomycetota bacterium]
MKTLILAVLNWLHLIATVIWVGGITFVLFIALPSAKELLGAEAGKIMGIISRRFTLYANYSILLLIVTGIAIVALSGGLSSIRGSDLSLAGAFILKHIAVLVMVAIHFYRGLVLTRRIKSAPPSKQPGLQKLSLNLVKVNFTLGLGVLLLSAVKSSG